MLDGVHIPMGTGNFEARGGPFVKHRQSAVTCAKTAEPFVVPF